jgi:hypothetical protein
VTGLGEGEQQQVEGEEGVTLGPHEGVGALEHGQCLAPEGRAVRLATGLSGARVARASA